MQDIPPRAQEAARDGRLIDAIRMVRDETGLGLKESKEAVEAFLKLDPVPGRAAQASMPLAVRRGDSPVRKMLIAILLLAAAAALLHILVFS